ncbi:MAG: hypothetical protein KKA62_01345 [Nanoarchaeota archaeon]|nr:hypothetical protein [Nanoarchaeota archaeon]MBU1644683.1 hypothetical protein [Nanoarchaeota archaeon]MBU1976578.1 hypothetical protein [Nanoarchaeota archaeon]
MSNKNFNKKAMAIGQVFIFIVAAITFALIMIFGYKAITGFLKSGEDVAFVQFKTSLETSIRKIYTEYGSVRVSKFTLPSIYEQVCFVNLDAAYDPELCKFDQAACSVWEDAKGYDSVDENVFMKPTAPVKIKVHQIGIDPDEGTDFLCVPVRQGFFNLVLEGKGDRTELSSVPSPLN